MTTSPSKRTQAEQDLFDELENLKDKFEDRTMIVFELDLIIEHLEEELDSFGRRIKRYTQEEMWKNLHELFKNGVDELNWIIGSTDGVHGSSFTLNEIEETLDLPEDDPKKNTNYFTILVIHPRLCTLKYAEIKISNRDQIYWLRRLITNSLYAMGKSQEGNTFLPDYVMENKS